jgi:hypothetical protein
MNSLNTTTTDLQSLAITNRLYRQGPPLPIIRSLHYFRHAIDEIRRQPLPRGYVQYLEYKLAKFK